MRLDHLLSKEHLTSSDVQNPDRRHMFFAGSSWVEHLTWHRDLVSGRVRNFGCWKEWGLGVGACTLLGPEGPGADLRVRFCSSGPLVVCPVGQAVRGTARTLRTTQWTRASCSRLSSWLHKMILKIISQFHARLSGLVSILIQTHVISSL